MDHFSLLRPERSTTAAAIRTDGRQYACRDNPLARCCQNCILFDISLTTRVNAIDRVCFRIQIFVKRGWV